MPYYFVFMIICIILSEKYFSNKYTLAAATIGLIILSGFRYYVGFDYATYAQIYGWMQKGLADWQIEKSPLFSWIMQIAIKNEWGYQFVIFISSVVFLLGFMYFIKNFVSNEYWMFSYFLLFATHLIFFSFNIFRQTFALGIVLIGLTYFLKKRNFLVVFILQFIAYEIHSISILFLLIYVVYFLSSKLKINRLYWLIYFISIIFMFINPVDLITMFFGNFLGRYADYLQTSHMDRNMLAILKQIVPNIVFAFYMYFFSKKDSHSEKEVIVFSGFFLYTIFSNIGVGIELIIRIGMLFLPFYIVGSVETLLFFDKKTRRFLYWAFILYGFLLVAWVGITNGFGVANFEWFFGRPLFEK